MQRRTTRRSALRALGAAGVIALAGCSALQDDSDPTQTTESPRAESDDGSAEDNGDGDATEPSGEIQMREVEVDGAVLTAFPVDGELTYVVGTDDDTRYVQQGDRKHPEFSEGVGKDWTWTDYFIDQGDLFYDAVREDGTRVIMRNDDVMIEDAGPIIDVYEGEPTWKADEVTWFVGDQEIVPDEEYEEVGWAGKADGEIFYEGVWHEEVSGQEIALSAIVHGGTVIDRSEINGRGDSRVVSAPDVAGDTFYYRAVEDNGEFLVADGNEVGGEYTSHSSGGGGEIGGMFDVGGDLGFIATVARDKRENESIQEEVLWVGGEEITRGRSIGIPKKIDGKLTYSLITADDDRRYMHGDRDLREEVFSNERYRDIRSVNGVNNDLALNLYLSEDAVDEEDRDQILLYQDQEFGPYVSVSAVHEYNDGLMFIAINSDDYRDNKLFVQEN